MQEVVILGRVVLYWMLYVQNFFCPFKRLCFILPHETNFNNYNLITMKKNLLLLSSFAMASVAFSQTITSIKEEMDGVTPCQTSWSPAGNAGGGGAAAGHDVTAAAFSNPMGSLTLTVSDNTTDSGPFYYGLTNDVVSNCGNEVGKGVVDISGSPKIKIRAKASGNTVMSVFAQEGASPSWDGAKFSSTPLKLNLTTSYQDFTLNTIAATSNKGGSPNIDLTKISMLAFEMTDATPGDVHFTGTIDIDYIYIGEYNVGVNELSSVSNFTLFPSPATSEVNLKFTAQEATTVTLTDITGRVMVSEQVSAGSVSKSYDVSGFAQGLYFVTISGANGQTTEKFMVK